MAGHGRPETRTLDASTLSLGIVATRWNATLVDHMVGRAKKAAADAGVSDVYVSHVAGSVELPIVAQALARRYDAVVALGVVIKGGTDHYHWVNQSVTDGLTRVALDESTPVAHGVLTVDNQAQADDRAGFENSTEDKGYEATMAALGAAIEIARIRQ